MLSLPSMTLYNSDSYERTVGIYRLAGGGIIETGYYDYNTKTLGPYTFPEKIGYVQDFYSHHPTPASRLLYKELLATETGLAAIFVNNSYVCILYPDALKYIDIDDKSSKVFNLLDDERPKTRRMANCGWVKTYMVCADVARLPYRLQYDIGANKVYLGNGKWVTQPGFPRISNSVDYPMYKRLLENPDATAIMWDAVNDKEVYL